MQWLADSAHLSLWECSLHVSDSLCLGSRKAGLGQQGCQRRARLSVSEKRLELGRAVSPKTNGDAPIETRGHIDL